MRRVYGIALVKPFRVTIKLARSGKKMQIFELIGDMI